MGPSRSSRTYTPPMHRWLARLRYCTANSAWFHAGRPPLPSATLERPSRSVASSDYMAEIHEGCLQGRPLLSRAISRKRDRILVQLQGKRSCSNRVGHGQPPDQFCRQHGARAKQSSSWESTAPAVLPSARRVCSHSKSGPRGDDRAARCATARPNCPAAALHLQASELEAKQCTEARPQGMWSHGSATYHGLRP